MKKSFIIFLCLLLVFIFPMNCFCEEKEKGFFDSARSFINGILSDSTKVIDIDEIIGFFGDLADGFDAFLNEEGNELIKSAYDFLENIFAKDGEFSILEAKGLFYQLCKELGMEDDVADSLWDLVYTYAEERELDYEALIQLLLDALTKIDGYEKSAVQEGADSLLSLFDIGDPNNILDFLIKFATGEEELTEDILLQKIDELEQDFV